MPVVPRSFIDAYTRSINRVSESARQTLSAMLARIDYSDLSKAIPQVKRAMLVCCGGSTDAATTLAEEFYNTLRRYETGESVTVPAVNERAEEATTEAVGAMAQDLVDGRPEAFRECVMQRVDYEVKRAAATAVFGMGRRDRRRVRFARVPSGSETCGFCMMLASRGFVYLTKETAGEGNHFHAHCDCRIVPDWGRGVVEGYDPDALYGRYLSGEFGSSFGSGKHAVAPPRPPKRKNLVSDASSDKQRRILMADARKATSREDAISRIRKAQDQWDRSERSVDAYNRFAGGIKSVMVEWGIGLADFL